jgi:ABC-type Fe3+ transport system permease subunit
VGRAVKAETIILWSCIALITVAGIAPVVVMVIDSVWDNGRFTFNDYRQLIFSVRFWPLLGNSVQLGFATTAVCGLIGIPTGIFFAKSDLTAQSIFLPVLTVPFVLAPYFLAIGWARFFAETGSVTSQGLFGFTGCVLVLSSVFLPITIILTLASSSSVDQALRKPRVQSQLGHGCFIELRCL